MRYVAMLTLLALCISPKALARNAWENPFHEPRAASFFVMLPEEYDSPSFLNIQEELWGCLYEYMKKVGKKGPKTEGALNPFVIHALGVCDKKALAVIRTHDRLFGKGTGVTYIERYLHNIREYVRDFFKVPVVESK